MNDRFPGTFALNGVEYTDLYILSYSIKPEILDGAGTGRSKAFGWPMIRDPQGAMLNLNLAFGVPDFMGGVSKSVQFRHLWLTVLSMGRDEFALVRFIDPIGVSHEQNMYLTASELKYKRISFEGNIFTDPLVVSFVAEKGE